MTPLDETAGRIQLRAVQFPGGRNQLVEAQVSPSFYDMNIFPHSVNFKYGALLNAILKTFLLPAVFRDGSDGYPKIDEYDEVIQTFMCGKEGLLPSRTIVARSSRIIFPITAGELLPIPWKRRAIR